MGQGGMNPIPSNFCQKCGFRVPGRVWAIAGAGFGVAFAVAGSMAGFAAFDGYRVDAERRERIASECMAGNVQACRIYEIDYAAKDGWS